MRPDSDCRLVLVPARVRQAVCSTSRARLPLEPAAGSLPVEELLPETHLVGRKQIQVRVRRARTQHAAEVREKLGDGRERRARWRRRLAADACSKRALCAAQPAKEPVATREREPAACRTQPRCSARQPARDAAREAKERERAHHEAAKHRCELDRQCSPAAQSPPPVGAEQPPASHSALLPALGVTAKMAVSDERAALLAVRADPELDAELAKTEIPLACDETLQPRTLQNAALLPALEHAEKTPAPRRVPQPPAARPTPRTSSPNSRRRRAGSRRAQIGRDRALSTTRGRPSTPSK
jgi:hypothetical protein